mmetsp:Transcript_21605/g.51255  ORF Transcript_21605/g.51255 Transcript_21605/m.51255 type:complete len:206 (-) Transcript_21605:509-1126(-)
MVANAFQHRGGKMAVWSCSIMRRKPAWTCTSDMRSPRTEPRSHAPSRSKREERPLPQSILGGECRARSRRGESGCLRCPVAQRNAPVPCHTRRRMSTDSLHTIRSLYLFLEKKLFAIAFTRFVCSCPYFRNCSSVSSPFIPSRSVAIESKKSPPFFLSFSSFFASSSKEATESVSKSFGVRPVLFLHTRFSDLLTFRPSAASPLT